MISGMQSAEEPLGELLPRRRDAGANSPTLRTCHHPLAVKFCFSLLNKSYQKCWLDTLSVLRPASLRSGGSGLPPSAPLKIAPQQFRKKRMKDPSHRSFPHLGAMLSYL